MQWISRRYHPENRLHVCRRACKGSGSQSSEKDWNGVEGVLGFEIPRAFQSRWSQIYLPSLLVVVVVKRKSTVRGSVWQEEVKSEMNGGTVENWRWCKVEFFRKMQKTVQYHDQVESMATPIPQTLAIPSSVLILLMPNRHPVKDDRVKTWRDFTGATGDSL